MTPQKHTGLGKDNPKFWKASLLEMDKALAGKKSSYWHRVVYPKPMARSEVKSLRTSLKLTPLDLEKILGMSLSTIRSWEQGTKHPVGLARKVLRSAMERPGLLEDLANA